MKRNLCLVCMGGAVAFCCAAALIAQTQDAPRRSPDALRAEAVALFQGGDRDAALASLQEAKALYEQQLREHPDDGRLARKLAMTLFELGEYDAARTLFQRALTLPDDGASNRHVHVSHVRDTPSASVAPLTVTPLWASEPLRGMEVHPDTLFDPDPSRTASNVTALVRRAVALDAAVVYAHGMTRPTADGAYGEAYFNSSQAPLRADLLAPLAEQLAAHRIRMHVIMPVLSLEVPAADRYRKLMVMSMGSNRIRPSRSWRKRLSPFNTNGLALMTQLYADLSTNVPLHGIVFGDDAYLTDAEDLNPAAIEAYKDTLDVDPFDLTSLSEEQQATLTDLKTAQLNQWCHSLMQAVVTNVPQAVFSRTLYAPAVSHPPSTRWLAQDYADALMRYDAVYLLADPDLEGATWTRSWLTALAERVVAVPTGLQKTVFRISAYSRERERWLSGQALAGTVRRLRAAGVRHVVLGPNDVVVNRPRLTQAKKVFQATP